jgi:hypothetical protein
VDISARAEEFRHPRTVLLRVSNARARDRRWTACSVPPQSPLTRAARSPSMRARPRARSHNR